ncbi:MAG: dihydroorotate dehydrogenase electron transfer subunit [Bacteroidales bacterium]|jgi:dihydroorotate dehydrogenase electron transfer subunit|nr:dihydroorotate dehydrogenase electron transfer subunit [Bacteroidales bacterium]
MDYFKSKVLSQTETAKGIYLLRLQVPEQQIKPGQFYMLKSWEDDFLPLMRPISVYRYGNGILEFLYRMVGKGTLLFSRLESGDEVDLLGALGNGFPCTEVKGKIALVGGGIGIPPLYETAKTLRSLGNIVDVYLGYKDDLFLVDEFADTCDDLFIACENGYEGYKGYITDIVNHEKYDAIFTCGPEVMMFNLLKNSTLEPSQLWLSMEKRMACGIGACLTCNCETTHGMKRCCSEGPVFRGSEFTMN